MRGIHCSAASGADLVNSTIRPCTSLTEKQGEDFQPEAVMRILCALLLLSFSISSVSPNVQFLSIVRHPQRDPQLGPDRHRQDRRSLRGFLPVRLRQLDEEQSHSCGQSRAGAALTACASAISTSCATFWTRPRRPATHRHPEESRRLLRGLHGRDRHREARHRTARADDECDRCNQEQAAADREVGALQRNGIRVLFSFGQMPDMHDSRQTIANLDQGGLTLPDRDYYLKDDAKSVETRQKYLEHVQKMFELAGDNPKLPLPKPRLCWPSRPGWPKPPWTAPPAAIPRIAIT